MSFFCFYVWHLLFVDHAQFYMEIAIKMELNFVKCMKSGFVISSDLVIILIMAVRMYFNKALSKNKTQLHIECVESLLITHLFSQNMK